jgi:hypothetical protein
MGLDVDTLLPKLNACTIFETWSALLSFEIFQTRSTHFLVVTGCCSMLPTQIAIVVIIYMYSVYQYPMHMPVQMNASAGGDM